MSQPWRLGRRKCENVSRRCPKSANAQYLQRQAQTMIILHNVVLSCSVPTLCISKSLTTIWSVQFIPYQFESSIFNPVVLLALRFLPSPCVTSACIHFRTSMHATIVAYEWEVNRRRLYHRRKRWKLGPRRNNYSKRTPLPTPNRPDL